MNPDNPTPREALEARLTALLLGELPADEAAALRADIARDAALAALHARLQQTVAIVRETAAQPATEAAEHSAPLRLADERREKLLAHFKTIAPREFAPPQKRREWFIPLTAAAAVVVLGTIAVSFPNSFRARSTSQRTAVLNNLRQIDGAKQQWALDNKKAASDVPTLDDLKPYLGRGAQAGLKPVAGETYLVGSLSELPAAEVDAKKAAKLFALAASPAVVSSGKARLSADGTVTPANDLKQVGLSSRTWDGDKPPQAASEKVEVGAYGPYQGSGTAHTQSRFLLNGTLSPQVAPPNQPGANASTLSQAEKTADNSGLATYAANRKTATVFLPGNDSPEQNSADAGIGFTSSLATTTDAAGHGTHVAGTILGSGSFSSTASDSLGQNKDSADNWKVASTLRGFFTDSSINGNANAATARQNIALPIASAVSSGQLTLHDSELSRSLPSQPAYRNGFVVADNVRPLPTAPTSAGTSSFAGRDTEETVSAMSLAGDRNGSAAQQSLAANPTPSGAYSQPSAQSFWWSADNPDINSQPPAAATYHAIGGSAQTFRNGTSGGVGQSIGGARGPQDVSSYLGRSAYVADPNAATSGANLNLFVQQAQSPDSLGLPATALTSANPDVARINGGKVVGVGPGTATVTATLADGSTITKEIAVNSVTPDLAHRFSFNANNPAAKPFNFASDTVESLGARFPRSGTSDETATQATAPAGPAGTPISMDGGSPATGAFVDLGRNGSSPTAFKIANGNSGGGGFGGGTGGAIGGFGGRGGPVEDRSRAFGFEWQAGSIIAGPGGTVPNGGAAPTFYTTAGTQGSPGPGQVTDEGWPTVSNPPTGVQTYFAFGGAMATNAASAAQPGWLDRGPNPVSPNYDAIAQETWASFANTGGASAAQSQQLADNKKMDGDQDLSKLRDRPVLGTLFRLKTETPKAPVVLPQTAGTDIDQNTVAVAGNSTFTGIGAINESATESLRAQNQGGLASDNRRANDFSFDIGTTRNTEQASVPASQTAPKGALNPDATPDITGTYNPALFPAASAQPNPPPAPAMSERIAGIAGPGNGSPRLRKAYDSAHNTDQMQEGARQNNSQNNPLIQRQQTLAQNSLSSGAAGSIITNFANTQPVYSSAGPNYGLMAQDTVWGTIGGTTARDVAQPAQSSAIGGFAGRGGRRGGGRGRGGNFGGGGAGGPAGTQSYPNATSPGPVSVDVDPETGSEIVTTDDNTYTNILDLVHSADSRRGSVNRRALAESNYGRQATMAETDGSQILQQPDVVMDEATAAAATSAAPSPAQFSTPYAVANMPGAPTTNPSKIYSVNVVGHVTTATNRAGPAANYLAMSGTNILASQSLARRGPVAPAPATEEPAAPHLVSPPLEPQPETLVSENAFSTFSLNVSDVSFKLAAASLAQGQMPDPGNIRSEEFINAFDYRDPDPAPGVPIGFAWERARYPFAHNRDLLRFSIKTAAAGRLPGRPLNLVLLLDNSGSMERADRVAIIHEALRVLAAQLQPTDKISVVTFSRTARLWVDGIPGTKAAQVLDLISQLTPEGGTDLGGALDLAYATATRHYLANGINRVVVLTDGAANLGDTNPDSLKEKVQAERAQGIALDCFGIGWEGYNDDLLEVLTRNGDGRYGFINSPEEAATGFAAQLAGALHVEASDVKVQVQFNPSRVISWRQIGYAKQQLTKEQFRDNTVHAAQIGAAEAGNGLYTVEINPQGSGPICTVYLRYRDPGTANVSEKSWDIPYDNQAVALESASPAMRLAATASAFSEWLGQSPYAGEVTTDQLLKYLNGVPAVFGVDNRPAQLEWMIRQAKSVTGK